MARILLADDYESMRMAVRSLIRRHPGWEDDGRKAVKKSTELKPDVILLDSRCLSQMELKLAARFTVKCPQPRL